QKTGLRLVPDRGSAAQQPHGPVPARPIGGASPAGSGAGAAHTPDCPGLNASPGVWGPVVAFRRRSLPFAGAGDRARASTVGRIAPPPEGVAGTPISLGGWLVCGRWVFGGESGPARRQGVERTPRRRPTPTTHS